MWVGHASLAAGLGSPQLRPSPPDAGLCWAVSCLGFFMMMMAARISLSFGAPRTAVVMLCTTRTGKSGGCGLHVCMQRKDVHSCHQLRVAVHQGAGWLPVARTEESAKGPRHLLPFHHTFACHSVVVLAPRGNVALLNWPQSVGKRARLEKAKIQCAEEDIPSSGHRADANRSVSVPAPEVHAYTSPAPRWKKSRPTPKRPLAPFMGSPSRN